MGASCATFLMYMPEEETFWMMERLLRGEKYWKFGNMYVPSFPLLMEFLYIHDRLLEKMNNKLFKHFSENNVESMTYALRWYSTIYSEFPRELMLRIYDIFLYEGVKILFRVAITILHIYEKK